MIATNKTVIPIIIIIIIESIEGLSVRFGFEVLGYPEVVVSVSGKQSMA